MAKKRNWVKKGDAKAEKPKDTPAVEKKDGKRRFSYPNTKKD